MTDKDNFYLVKTYFTFDKQIQKSKNQRNVTERETIEVMINSRVNRHVDDSRSRHNLAPSHYCL